MYINHKLRSKNLKHIELTDLPVWLMDALISEAQPYGVDIAKDYLDALLQMHDKVDVVDLGAGSRKMGKKRRISDIVRYSVSNYDDLLFLSRLTYFKKPLSVLELGTSLGVSSCMLAHVVPRANIVSVEGCPNIYKFTCEHIKPYLTGNLKLVNTEFESFLQDNDNRYDMIFIDGNHRYDATLRLFDKASAFLNKDGVIVLDDIYWSWGMHKAWNKIKRRENFMAVDLYQTGILTEGKQGNLSIRLNA